MVLLIIIVAVIVLALGAAWRLDRRGTGRRSKRIDPHSDPAFLEAQAEAYRRRSQGGNNTGPFGAG